MDAAEVSKRVRELMATQLGLEETEVVSQASILDDLGADSLDVVELMMALEEFFDIEVPDDAVEGIRTVGDIETYIASRLGA